MDDPALRDLDRWLGTSAELLLGLVGGIALVGICWVLAGAAFAAASHLPGRAGRLSGRFARRFTPALVGRLLAATLGLTVASAGAASASAAQGGGAPPVPQLDRPGGTTASDPIGHAEAASPRAPVPSPPAAVVVRPGDTLWAIAARALPDPSPAAVAGSWPDWYAANRAVIGPDPNLIRPGQRLVPPAGS